MQLNERRHRSRFQRSLSDRHFYGQNRQEERETQQEEMEKEYRYKVVRRPAPKELDLMSNVKRWLPLAIGAAVAYWLIVTYVF
jgi:hypothetical protein